jgi:hypothetical protein
MKRSTDVVLTAEGCYGVLADAGSPGASPDIWTEAAHESKEALLAANDESFMQLFHYNDQLHQRQARGELLVWALIVGGSWRARFRVVDGTPPELTDPDPVDWLEDDAEPKIIDRTVSRLVLPTGKLRFIDNHTVNMKAVDLEPGEYVVEFLRNHRSEALGYDLMGKSPRSRPTLSGVAWRFSFWRVGDVQ